MNIVIKKLREGATRVTQTKDGIMSWPDKVKLDYLETTIVTSSQINGNIIVDDEELVVYVHPVSHPASIITQDPTHRFVSDSEKSTWNNKLDSFGYTPENIANKGQPNGYASLNSSGKLAQHIDVSLVDNLLAGSDIIWLGEFNTAPSGPSDKDMYYNTTSNILYIYNNGWIDLSSRHDHSSYSLTSHIHSEYANTSHSHNASSITSGTIDIARLPAGALERLHIVADQTARLALTSSVVQNGDTVKQNDTGAFYFVIDENNLSNPSSYVVYTVGTATSVPWSGVTGRPDTLAGYGITDSALINHSHTFDSITTRPSTLSGYGITDGALDSHVHNFSTLTNKPTTINTYGITDAMRWRGTLASDPSEPIINDVYSDSTLNKLCIYNGSNWITIGVGSNSKIISEGGVEVVGPDGINTNYIKNFKNMVHNSQFEVYDLATLKPAKWLNDVNSGVVDPNSNFWGTVSLKLTQNQQTWSLGNIVAAWYHTNGKNKTRVSFYKRSANTDGYIQLRVYNTSGLGEYVTLTTTDDVKAGTEQVGTALVFANNTSWQSSRVSAWFDHTAIDVNGGLQIEFKNVSNYPCDIWIDGVQLEPNETKFPYIYSDGQYSSPNAIVNSKTAGSSTPTYLSIWAGTQAEYTAIVTKDPATLYFVTT